MGLDLGLEGAVLGVVARPERRVGDRVVDDLGGVVGEGLELGELEVGEGPVRAGRRRRGPRARVLAARGRARTETRPGSRPLADQADRARSPPRGITVEGLARAGRGEKLPIDHGREAGPGAAGRRGRPEQAHGRALRALVAQEGVGDYREDAVEVGRLGYGRVDVAEDGGERVDVGLEPRRRRD